VAGLTNLSVADELAEMPTSLDEMRGGARLSGGAFPAKT